MNADEFLKKTDKRRLDVTGVKVEPARISTRGGEQEYYMLLHVTELCIGVDES